MAQRVGRGIALLFHDRGTSRGEWSAARPGRTLTPGKTRYPLYRRLGGPQGQSGLAENLVPTWIRSRTVQPRSSVAIPTELPGPHNNNNNNNNATSVNSMNTMIRDIHKALQCFKIHNATISFNVLNKNNVTFSPLTSRSYETKSHHNRNYGY